MLLNRAMSASQQRGHWLSALELLRLQHADVVGLSSAVAACAAGRAWRHALLLLRLASMANEITFNSVPWPFKGP